MHITFENDLFIIVDNFLHEDSFLKFWSFVQSEHFEFVHSREWVDAFRLNDGNPLWSRPAISHKRTGDQRIVSFPTDTAFDIFIGALINAAGDYHRIIGQFGRDWDFFFSRMYLYPRDTGLSWHTDGKYDISGAYVFYAHPQWKASWGAELQINSVISPNLEYPLRNTGYGSSKQVGFHLDNTLVDDALLEPGFGHFILPKPNRLVLIRNKLLHQIKKVEPSAGSHIRCSVTGFFMSDKKIADIKERTQ